MDRPPALTVHRPIRFKLVGLSILLLLVVSFGFTALNVSFSRRWVEEDLRERAIMFAREIAATIADRREFESGALLDAQIRQVLTVRQSVLQLDILAFTPSGSRVVATSDPATRMPFTRKDVEQILHGRVVSRLITEAGKRYWEVMAPVTLERAVAGAVTVKFSLHRADQLASRMRNWSFALAAASAIVTGLLMGLAVQLLVDRPIGRFMEAIARIRRGDAPGTVSVRTADEFGVLATHFNEMIARLNQFSEELQRQVEAATVELEHRYREVQRLNETLFAAQRSLSHAERLALSGRIVAQVAHEVGTPLHSLAGHLELLRTELPQEVLSSDLGRRLTVIETQLTRVIQIIAQLLDLTRRSPGESGPVELNRLVRDTVELVRPGVTPAGPVLEVVTEPARVIVQGYANQLQQVILNLLTNAIDATPTGGHIVVTTRLARDAGEAMLEVADTGRGIPTARRYEIFKPFFTTKAPGRGTGLGLFISLQIVRDHKGRVEVESEEGRGTTFRVFFPVIGDAA